MGNPRVKLAHAYSSDLIRVFFWMRTVYDKGRAAVKEGGIPNSLRVTGVPQPDSEPPRFAGPHSGQAAAQPGGTGARQGVVHGNGTIAKRNGGNLANNFHAFPCSHHEKRCPND